jgi:hypothetical protein
MASGHLHEIRTGKARIFRDPAIAAARGAAMIALSSGKGDTRGMTRVLGVLWQIFMILLAFMLGIPALLVGLAALGLLMGAIVYAIAEVVALVAAFFPAHSAEFYVKERDVTVTLAFYDLWSSPGPQYAEEDGSRTLTLRTPDGRVTHWICDDDWMRRSRTSLYLVGDHDFAVVGPNGCDYLITTRPMAVSRAREERSRDWIYLGAFDFVDDRVSPGHQSLQFFPAFEEQECIEGQVQSFTVRNDARRDSCSPIPHRR